MKELLMKNLYKWRQLLKKKRKRLELEEEKDSELEVVVGVEAARIFGIRMLLWYHEQRRNSNSNYLLGWGERSDGSRRAGMAWQRWTGTGGSLPVLYGYSWSRWWWGEGGREVIRRKK